MRKELVLIAEKEYGFAHKATLDHQRRLFLLIDKMELWSEGEALYERVIKQQDEFNLYDKWYVLWAYGILLMCLKKQDKKEKELACINEFNAYRNKIFKADNIFGVLVD